ncbi:hypothetical protein [Chitinilyticum litopenaei]|nr:hypothetical protein [Chitinilyticum litopenaei]
MNEGSDYTLPGWCAARVAGRDIFLAKFVKHPNLNFPKLTIGGI